MPEGVNKFRTQDKEFLAKLKKQIVENSNSNCAWNTVYNQLYMDDMMEYLRSISVSTVISGNGSFTPKIVIVVKDGKDNTIQDVKAAIRRLNKKPDDFWITPLIKSTDISSSILTEYLFLEIKRLSPKIILDLTGVSLHNELTKLGFSCLNGSTSELDSLIEQSDSCCKMG